MHSCVGVLVYFKFNSISVTMRRDYDALRLANGVTWSATCTRYVRKKNPYKALEKFSKAVYGTTGGTCSARDDRQKSRTFRAR